MKRILRVSVALLLIGLSTGATCELGSVQNFSGTTYAIAPQPPLAPGQHGPVPFPVYSFPTSPPFNFGVVGSIVIQQTPITAPVPP